MSEGQTIILDLETVAIDTAADFIEPVHAPSNWKDYAKIEKYVDEKTAELTARAALDVDLARIVAFGWCRPEGADTIETWVCEDEAAERDVLKELRPMLVNASTITYNGLGYDLPLLERRMLYLGLKPLRWNLNKYRTNHIDLMQVLTYNGAIKPHKLDFYRRRFGLKVGETIKGADVGLAVKEDRWDDVLAHVRADVDVTYQLAQKMGVIG